MIYYFINMTAEEFFWCIFIGFIIAGVVIGIITAIAEKIAENIERKREMERRACKRYNAPIRPVRRY